MQKSFKIFWIYWGALVLGCILFFLCPLLFFIFLPTLLVIIPVWIIVAGLIGKAVQKKRRLERVSKRIGVSFLCSCLVMAVFPVGLWIDDFLKWHKFRLDYLLDSLNDGFLWTAIVIHFFAFWIGEEIGWAELREENSMEDGYEKI